MFIAPYCIVLWVKEEMFTQSIIEQIGYYVYFLRDPRDQRVFYVGKGVGNRLFNHVHGALSSEDASDKLDTVREINKAGYAVEHFILRHGLQEKESFEVEAALIDFVGLSFLTNEQSGHYSTDFGLKSSDEIIAMYSAPKFGTDLPVLLININRLFHRQMTANEIYEATRSSWKLSNRKDKAKFAIATYKGLTREVYLINDWYKEGERWAFNGIVAENEVRESLRYKSIAHLAVRGAANPVRYINC